MPTPVTRLHHASSADNARSIAGLTGQRLVLDGYYSVDDPGGGLLAWSGTPATDDGVFVFNVGGLGTSSAGWRRIVDRSAGVSVAWAGAVGDGVDHSNDGSYDSGPLQRAAFAAYQRMGPAAGLLGTGYQSGPPITIPRGTYKTTSEIALTEYQSVVAERGAVIVAQNDTFPIFRLAGAYNSIEGLTFGNGKNHIAFYGYSAFYGGHIGNPANGNSTVRLANLTMRYPKGPAICQVVDSDPSTQRASTLLVLVENLDFEGACLLYGSFDLLKLGVKRITFDRSGSIKPVDASIEYLGLINSLGIMDLTSDIMVPYAAAGTQAVDSCWIAGGGVIRCRGVRFGGEAQMTGIRCTEVLPYDGQSLPFAQEGLPPHIDLDGCALESAANLNWLEVKDGSFPSLISVRNPVLNPTYGESMVGSRGVWISDTIDMDALSQLRRRKTCTIDLPESLGYYAGRFRQGPDAQNDSTMTDVSDRLRPFFGRSSFLSPETVQPDPARVSLWSGISDIAAGTFRSAVNITVAGVADPATGLKKISATTYGAVAVVEITNPATGWQPASGGVLGEYVFQAKVLSNFSGVFQLSIFDAAGVAEIERVQLPFVSSRSIQIVQARLWLTGPVRLLFDASRFGPTGTDGAVSEAAYFECGNFAVYRGV